MRREIPELMAANLSPEILNRRHPGKEVGERHSRQRRCPVPGKEGVRMWCTLGIKCQQPSTARVERHGERR